MSFPGFDPSFFKFLKALKANNNREWFNDHKDTYIKDVETPAREFVQAFQPKLKTISPRFVADPRRLGGSMFRIYRDTRFSPNKAPYKTYIGLRFWHDKKEIDSRPIFYLHLEPGRLFGGGGVYHPDPVTLRKIRLTMVERPKEWEAVMKSGVTVTGETLQRVPVGFAKDHPFADDLKRKGHVVMTPFTMADAQSPDFLEQYTDACRTMTTLMKFLTSALELRW
jgi:uncharacterized protein (TIGR02453 family)